VEEDNDDGDEKFDELVLNPLSVPIDSVPGDVQIEIIELQYSNVWLFDFRSKYIGINSAPAVQSHGLRIVSLFGITYLYHQLFFEVGEC
jgi:hypothetical protein